jgi:hypothetical protein
MEGIVPYAIWFVLGLSGLSLLAMLLFGIRSLAYGKLNMLSIVFFAIPAILLVVLGFTTGDWAHAAVMTFMVMFAVTSVSLLLSGIRGLIGF